MILLLAAAAVLQAGCGGSSSSSEASKSASAILADARRAATAAGSVRVAGTIDDSGQMISLDLSITGHGGGGTLTVHGTKVDIVRSGTSVYIRAPGSFYRSVGASKAAGQLLDGRWLKAPVSTPQFGDFSQLTDLNKFVALALKPQGTVTKGAQTTIDGQKVIGLQDSKGRGVLYVATTGTPYAVEFKGVGGESGTLKLTDWGSAHAPKPPPNAIDIGALGK